ncbi:glycosyltransferase [Rivibacter subsaxonicus]|uniref:Glycosyltransferase involved in cell wall biosynthesis n=1 Tax=Rivibacter subsaxonicus TaxID=457575 RepID=A0A4V2FUJ6_9BURK|nr:glycosyltransferase [Rivibacter subsaxonicus]RZU02266.1 glycosyltransferase involved in cell wall biosynthesis [Rivibacter subsaxonicus]
MKLLIVSPTPTHPTTAGNRARVLALARGIEQLGHELHVAQLLTPDADAQAMRAAFGERLHLLMGRTPHASPRWPARLRRRGLQLLRDPDAYLWGLDDYFDAAILRQLGELQQRHGYEAVIVEYVFWSRALEAFGDDVLKVIDTHDRFANRHLMFLANGQQPRWFSTLPSEEARGLMRADHVLAIQPTEAVMFSQQIGGTRPVEVVGHLLDIDPVVPATSPSAVFLASANDINLEAGRYLIDRVLPLVRQQLPEFNLILAGDVSQVAAAGTPGVVAMGRVGHVRDAFSRAALALNPVRMGTGLTVKMMDGLACAMPCISSHSGSRGLEAQRDHAFLCVPDDDPAAMAEAILMLLASPERARGLAEAGLSFARAWNDRQIQSLRQLLGAKNPRHALT